MSIRQRAIVRKTHQVLAHLCGKMRLGRIVLCAGDEVDVELSEYDLHRGRIVWRHAE